jgi:hypothetical protein
VLSATQLQATISAADLATARAVPVTVAYPGGAVSNALPFVVAPAPVFIDGPGGGSVWLPLIRR